MCRILGWVGPGLDLRTLLYAPPHSLERQALAAPLQHDGRGGVNVDGWGVGWWTAPDDPPRRYRSATCMAEDPAFRDGAAERHASAAIAAVRNASPGATVEEAGSSPFLAGRWLFTHNGYVDGFRTGLGDVLASEVTTAQRAGIEGDADSEVVFALVLDQLDAGADPESALTDVLADLARRAPDSRLNLLLGDGRTLWATRWGNSLFTHRDWQGGRVVASEPLDATPGWTEVPDRSLVTLDAAEVRVAPIEASVAPHPPRKDHP